MKEDLASPGSIPPLAPPRGAMLPTFWEQYGLWIVLGGVALAALAVGLIWLWRRPRATAPVSPETQARQALEPLRQRIEDGAVLSRVSQILRHYVTAAFGLPDGELTTTELCRALNERPQLGPEFPAAVGDFLRECDRRKFAPAPPAPPLDAVAQALKLIEMAEALRAPAAQGSGAAN
jgi:hypothetical protein